MSLAHLMERREEHYSNYFVQSPSTAFHDTDESEFLSPTRFESVPLVHESPMHLDLLSNSKNNFIYEDDEKRLVPLRSSKSGWWIVLQVIWKFLFSLGVGLLVFYIATQPPHPNISVRIGKLNQFMLEEGVDSHGAVTKFLTCNCSTKLMVDNKSNVFGLHIHPPSLKFFFGPFNFAKAQGPKLYVSSQKSRTFEVYIGTKKRAMYGAGREMDDMLRSRTGLPLILRMSIMSDIRVVWNIIKPKYHHKVECFLLLAYNERHDQVMMVREKCKLVS